MSFSAFGLVRYAGMYDSLAAWVVQVGFTYPNLDSYHESVLFEVL